MSLKPKRIRAELETAFQEYRRACYGSLNLPTGQLMEIRLAFISGVCEGVFAMPLAKGAGISLLDPETLEDLRPDLLLIDDPQSH